MPEQQLSEIYRAVGRIEGQLGEIKDLIETQRADTNVRFAAQSLNHEGHQKRISNLENRQHWYSGFAAAIGALLGIGGTHFVK